MDIIYLDYNATTPIDPRVAEAILPYIHSHFGNPSSSHAFGLRARAAVEKARAQVAGMLGCKPEEIVFTSGGSESNNHAIKGAARAGRSRGNHIITSAVEHPAVTEVCRDLENEGFRVTTLPVDEHGLVDPQQLEEAITPETILITIMHANNEVGTIEPIEEISKIARGHGVVVHTDTAQSIGKIPVRVDDLGIDLLSIAGHKLYAPKGIGALYIHESIRIDKLIHGAGHESGRRAGTENVPWIVGLGEACAMVNERLARDSNHLREMRDRLERGLKARFPDARVHGHPEKRLPNTLSIGFRGLQAGEILSKISTIAASAGSACHSDHVQVSSVLKAMAVPLEYALGTLRFSVGRSTTPSDIDRALEHIIAGIKPLQRNS